MDEERVVQLVSQVRKFASLQIMLYGVTGATVELTKLRTCELANLRNQRK